MKQLEKKVQAIVTVWCGLTLHHAESAQDLPTATQELISQLKAFASPMRDNLVLAAIIEDRAFAGFGVILTTMSTSLTPYQVRTSLNLPQVYKEDIRNIRDLFKKLGFRRAANLYVTTMDE